MAGGEPEEGKWEWWGGEPGSGEEDRNTLRRPGAYRDGHPREVLLGRNERSKEIW